jgi:hypothetical protein
MEKLKIKKNLIGAKVFHVTLNQYIEIEEGKEDLYENLGLNVFETPSTPKLKRNAKKTTKKRNIKPSGNSDRTNNDK